MAPAGAGLPVAVDYSTAGEIVRLELDLHSVTEEEAMRTLHLPANSQRLWPLSSRS